MAVAGVITGDRSSLTLQLSNVATQGPMILNSGSFRPSPEERRVVSLFVRAQGTTGAFDIEIRLEYFNPRFATRTILGAPVAS